MSTTKESFKNFLKGLKKIFLAKYMIIRHDLPRESPVIHLPEDEEMRNVLMSAQKELEKPYKGSNAPYKPPEFFAQRDYIASLIKRLFAEGKLVTWDVCREISDEDYRPEVFESSIGIVGRLCDKGNFLKYYEYVVTFYIGE